jgi:nucleotide-binding universal stress UspA family protein
MFKSIIWATDGSATADRAMPYVKSLATDSSSEVVVLHCDELLVGRGGGQHMIPDEEDMRQKIDAQARELTDAGIKTAARVVTVATAGTAHTIADTAQELGSDLIVVGTRGHTALAGLLLGGVTQRLLHISPCPVFVVPASVEGESPAAESAAAEATA